MNFQILNMIVALCVGSSDTQLCHKKFQGCILAQKNYIAAEVKQCESVVDEKSKINCRHNAYIKEKPVATVLEECL